jgi:hypothetical protein
MRGPDGWRMQPFLFAAQALPETDLGPVAVKPTCRPSTLMPLIDSVLASRRIAAPSLLCVHHGPVLRAHNLARIACAVAASVRCVLVGNRL